MALDTIAGDLKVECVWVQTVNPRRRSLRLAADRGFSPEMRVEIAEMNLEHGLSEHIVGTGQKIVIPDLNNDGRYGLASFRQAGYRWLVAVPLLTYRVHGVLGIASRHKKRLHKETAELALVIAGLIGAALNQAGLYQRSARAERPQSAPEEPATEKALLAEPPTADPPPEATPTPTPELAFHRHARRMERFKRGHG